jgi:predicted MFS family arabinose efflux permease
MKDHGLTEGQIGWILGLENGLMIITALAWGRWADHSLKFRRCLVMGSAGVMVSLWLFSRADTMADFVLYGVFRGLSTTSLMGLMPAMALANLDPLKPGAGFGGYRRYGSIGFLLAAAGLPLLFDTIPQMAMAVMGALPLSLWFVLRLSDPVRNRGESAKAGAMPNAWSVWLFLIAHFFVSMAEPGVHGFFSAYARDLGASIEWVGILSGLTGLIALMTLGFMGRWADRIGAPKILLIGFAAQGVRMALTSFITNPDWLWLPHLLHGFGWAGREVGTLLFFSAIMGKARWGMASSIVMSVRMAGMMVGSMMMGQIAESAGYVVMFRVVSVCVFVGLVVLVFALRGGRKVNPS